MKKTLKMLLLFISISGFSQNNINYTHIQSIKFQIDSIAQHDGYHSISEGNISITRKEKEIGRGGFSYKYYIYNPDTKLMKDLSISERKKINLNENQKLIKGQYNQVIHYT